MLALHIPCHACTHIRGRDDQDAHLPCSPPVCWQPLRLRGRGVSASDGSGPSCLSCSISSGLSPAPLVSNADYKNHICLCFVFFLFFSLFSHFILTFLFILFCFVFFSLFSHFFVFPGDTTGTLYLQVAIKEV